MFYFQLLALYLVNLYRWYQHLSSKLNISFSLKVSILPLRCRQSYLTIITWCWILVLTTSRCYVRISSWNYNWSWYPRSSLTVNSVSFRLRPASPPKPVFLPCGVWNYPLCFGVFTITPQSRDFAYLKVGLTCECLRQLTFVSQSSAFSHLRFGKRFKVLILWLNTKMTNNNKPTTCNDNNNKSTSPPLARPWRTYLATSFSFLLALLVSSPVLRLLI